MKATLIVLVSGAAVVSLACAAVTSIIPPFGNPIFVTGSITIQGDGIRSICSSGGDISCTGNTTVSVIPSPEDFTLQVDQTGKFIGGRANIKMNVKENYQYHSGECNGPFNDSLVWAYTGNIPLPAQGGPAATSATYYGGLTESVTASDVISCASGGWSGGGSGTITEEGVTLELVGFSPKMQQGDGGACNFAALKGFEATYSPWHATCTYRIEDITTLIRTGTPSP